MITGPSGLHLSGVVGLGQNTEEWEEKAKGLVSLFSLFIDECKVGDQSHYFFTWKLRITV